MDSHTQSHSLSLFTQIRTWIQPHTHTVIHTDTETDIDEFLPSTSDVFVVGQQSGHGHGEQLGQVTQTQAHVQPEKDRGRPREAIHGHSQ